MTAPSRPSRAPSQSRTCRSPGFSQAATHKRHRSVRIGAAGGPGRRGRRVRWQAIGQSEDGTAGPALPLHRSGKFLRLRRPSVAPGSPKRRPSGAQGGRDRAAVRRQEVGSAAPR
jgi:hypothetical protein